MKALVVGYGSIGRRHVRLLTSLGCDVAVVSHLSDIEPKRYSDIAEALASFSPDYVVIANSTSRHEVSLQMLVEAGFDGLVLVEKPLFEAPHAAPAHKFARIGVGYNLRFHPVLRALRNILEKSDIFTITAYAGQHLAGWRPDRDYRTTSSATRGEGGGVLRDLSHELDYLLWLAGPWRRLSAVGGNFGDLAIETEDVMNILFAADRCPSISLALNYLDRPGARWCRIQTSQGTLHMDLWNGLLEVNGVKQEFPVGKDETYIDQHRAMLRGHEHELLCSLDEGYATLEMIAAIERASVEGATIRS